MIEVRDVDGAGRGYFANPSPAQGDSIPPGTCVLEATPLVWVVKDGQELRTCRQCVQPCSIEDWRCPDCRRSASCFSCSQAMTPTAVAAAGGVGSGADLAYPSQRRFPHDILECESLARLSALERDKPKLLDSLLGSSTVYLRMLLRLLRLRAAEVRKVSRGAGQCEPSSIDELDDHMDDLLEDEELAARIANTIAAVKLVAPAEWKANQDVCAEFLGKLYCNSMTIGKIGLSTSLVQQGYWSGIRGCLYTDFGVGLYPTAAMFNHSCAPNCAWASDAEGRVRVFTVEDVPSGSQLCISYVDILQPGPARRDQLREHFFFRCACARCVSYGPPQSAAPATFFCQRYILADDVVAGGWVCQKRGCCRRGAVVRRPRRVGDHSMEPSPSSCGDCGGVLEDTYFERWTSLLQQRLTAADLDITTGRVWDGQRKLQDLQALCDRRLVSTHAFSFGICCRLLVLAAVRGDWPEMISRAARALASIRALRQGAEHVMRSRRSSEALLPAAMIWEAILVDALDRSILLSDHAHHRGEDRHAGRSVFPDGAAKMWCLERSDLVQLS